MTPPANPAETYELFMVPTLFRPWAARLLQLADPQPGERILDVACGTGVVARSVAAQTGGEASITGVDISPDMLAVAKSAAAREGRAISWHEGNAEALPFADGLFDLVLCQFALMFFDDRRAALAEMHRVLADGGRITISTWQGLDQHPFYQTLHDVLRWHLGSSSIDQIFSAGDAEELRRLVTGAGFHSIEIRSVSMSARFPNPEGFLAGEIDVDTAAIPAMQHLEPMARGLMVETIRADMAGALSAVTEGNEVVMPFHAHLLRAWH